MVKNLRALFSALLCVISEFQTRIWVNSHSIFCEISPLTADRFIAGLLKYYSIVQDLFIFTLNDISTNGTDGSVYIVA